MGTPPDTHTDTPPHLGSHCLFPPTPLLHPGLRASVSPSEGAGRPRSLMVPPWSLVLPPPPPKGPFPPLLIGISFLVPTQGRLPQALPAGARRLNICQVFLPVLGTCELCFPPGLGARDKQNPERCPSARCLEGKLLLAPLGWGIEPHWLIFFLLFSLPVFFLAAVGPGCGCGAARGGAWVCWVPAPQLPTDRSAVINSHNFQKNGVLLTASQPL